MKRSKWVLVVVLLLMMLIPVLASAQGNDRPERLVTAVLTRGQAINPNAPAKDSAAPYVPSTRPNRVVQPQSNAEKMGLPRGPQLQGALMGFKETFEGAWPGGSWSTYDNNGSLGGDVCWDDESYLPHKGFWSAWAAGGCADGLDPSTDWYVDDMESWMTYGPINTTRATTGVLTFKYQNESEVGYDYLFWCASVDDINYYCFGHTGSTNGRWRGGKIDLKNVPGYGRMLGEDTVYLAWIFYSDFSVIDQGPFVDDVKLKLSN